MNMFTPITREGKYLMVRRRSLGQKLSLFVMVSSSGSCITIHKDFDCTKAQRKPLFSKESEFNLNYVSYRVNCNARTTCTNSSGVKPDLGLDQDQQ